MISLGFTVFGFVAAAFASTNLDNLLLLVGWMMGGTIARSTMLAGYLLGMLGVLLLSYAIALLGNLLPIEYLGYLGVVPMALGLKMLWDMVRSKALADDVSLAPTRSGNVALILAVAFTQLSNGIDTVLVFSPAMAESRDNVDGFIVLSFVVMIFVWFGVANWLSHHAQRIQLVTKIGSWLAPLVMIAVGLYILADTATDVVG